VTTGQVMVAGEITTKTYVDIPKHVRETILRIGYDSADVGFDGRTCGVSVAIDEQSPDIAQGVDTAYESRQGQDADPYDIQGAGDQGMMFGYASDETPQLMPLPIHLAHRMAERLTEVRKNGEVGYLRPDGKTQVTVAYEDGVPKAVTAVVLSTQHRGEIDLESQLRPDIEEHVIRPLSRTTSTPTAAHLRQPDRPLRDRRSGRRRRPDRPQDHRRHLRRDGPPRWRRVLGQGPLEGRPLGGLRDPLGGQEHRCGRAGAQGRAAGRLRHRGVHAGVDRARDLRDRDRSTRTRS
jgi:hypothetical protein